MKVNQIGTVTFAPTGIKIEGWNVEREASDPADATSEQLLTNLAVKWAQGQLQAALMTELVKQKAAQAETAN